MPIVKFRNSPFTFRLERVTQRWLNLSVVRMGGGYDGRRGTPVGGVRLDYTTHTYNLDQAVLYQADAVKICEDEYMKFIPITRNDSYFTSCVTSVLEAALTADQLFQSLKVKPMDGIKVKCERNFRGAYHFHLSPREGESEMYNIVQFLEIMGLCPLKRS